MPTFSRTQILLLAIVGLPVVLSFWGLLSLLRQSPAQTWPLLASSRVIAISPSGQLLATAAGRYVRQEIGRNRSTQGPPNLEIRQVSDGSVLHTLKFFSASSLAFSPDDLLLAAGGYGGQVQIWRTSDGQPVRSLSWSAHPWASILALAFSPDSQTLVAADTGTEFTPGQATVWNVADGQLRYSLPGGYSDAAISPDGQQLALCSRQQPVTLHRLSDGTQRQQLEGATAVCRQISFSPDGRQLAVLTYGGKKGIRLYNLSEGALVYYIPVDSLISVTDIGLSPNGRYLAAAYGIPATGGALFGFSEKPVTSHGPIRLWRADNAALVRTWRGHERGSLGLAFSPDSQWLASVGYDSKIRFWRMPR